MAPHSVLTRSCIYLLSLAFIISGYHVYAEKKRAPVPWAEQRYDTATIERLIHDGINEERKKSGLGLLAWNESLHNIAQKHSNDMAKRNYFSHVNPEGASFSDRYKAAQFSCSIQIGMKVFSGAENISQDNLYDSVSYRNDVPTYCWKSSDEIARSVVFRWMKSPPHKKNILFPHWNSQGLGISITSEGKVLVTENFC